jgi:hypothetical protein
VRPHFRTLTVVLTLFALLFSSAAMAGYACPGSAKAAEVARMFEEAAPCAEAMSAAMDEEQPGLCHAHCQSGTQAAENFHPTVFADLIGMGAVLTVLLIPPPAGSGELPPAISLQRETGPPLAVRYCCFRI